jgi:hypothetical protein
MRRSTSLFDPAADPIAHDVIAAFKKTAEARRSACECYKAAVRVWRQAHPDQNPEYASKQAVGIVLKIRARFLLRTEV